MTNYISIDPGKSKCGIVIADIDSRIVLDGIVAHKDIVLELVNEWIDSYSVELIIIGNGTSSKYWLGMLKDLAPVQIVEERGSTLRARNRYWELFPPGICCRWLPRGLIIPPNYLDAVAALVLLEDYLCKKLQWRGSRNFKIWPEQ